MKSSRVKIDFSEVRNKKLTCLEQCGKCCFYQAPVLTTTEINRILNHLNTKRHEEFEKFSLDWLSYLSRLPELTNELLDDCIKSLTWFWSPFQLEEAEQGTLVRSYTIHSMPSTGRCKLLNPIDRKCFIYPARPDTCRLYPFIWKRDKTGVIKIELGMQNCPGISKGQFNLSKSEIEQQIREGFIQTEKDIMAYEKYIADKNIKRRTRTRRKKSKYKEPEDIHKAILDFEKHWRDMYFFGKKQKFAFKGKRFIEPLAELRIIPRHPLLVLWNDNLAKTK